jgi:hypothetical protein
VINPKSGNLYSLGYPMPTVKQPEEGGVLVSAIEQRALIARIALHKIVERCGFALADHGEFTGAKRRAHLNEREFNGGARVTIA